MSDQIANDEQYTAAVDEYSRLKEDLYLHWNEIRSMQLNNLRRQLEEYERRQTN
jgi:hypothetical protein